MAEKDLYYLIFVSPVSSHVKYRPLQKPCFQYKSLAVLKLFKGRRYFVFMCTSLVLIEVANTGQVQNFHGLPSKHLPPQQHPHPFSFPPFTTNITQVWSYLIPILHMHNRHSPFMPFQGHHSTSFLSLSNSFILNSPKNHVYNMLFLVPVFK